jgi:hypothetical protein
VSTTPVNGFLRVGRHYYPWFDQLCVIEDNKACIFFLPIHQRKLKYKDGKDASRQQITNHTMELHEEQ